MRPHLIPSIAILLVVSIVNVPVASAQSQGTPTTWESLAAQELGKVSSPLPDSALPVESRTNTASTITPPAGYATKSGVDILDESLKYHANMSPSALPSGAIPPEPGQFTGSSTGTIQNSNLSGSASLYTPGANIPGAISPLQTSTLQPQNGVASLPVINGAQAVPCTINVIQTPPQAPPKQDLAENLLGVDSKTIGIVGATALMGSFISNGGVGGMLKSVGWDNKRHIRGQSIGGY